MNPIFWKTLRFRGRHGVNSNWLFDPIYSARLKIKNGSRQINAADLG